VQRAQGRDGVGRQGAVALREAAGRLQPRLRVDSHGQPRSRVDWIPRRGRGRLRARIVPGVRRARWCGAGAGRRAGRGSQRRRVGGVRRRRQPLSERALHLDHAGQRAARRSRARPGGGRRGLHLGWRERGRGRHPLPPAGARSRRGQSVVPHRVRALRRDRRAAADAADLAERRGCRPRAATGASG
jgi:hypothetical protein